LGPRFAGSHSAKDDRFVKAIKSAALLPSEGKKSQWSHVIRFYSMLKTLVI
jgi:hypothetical protein